ncbi:MAG: DNA-directed RNA polymerase subunit omega [Pirellulaceae bacterium]|jgi:DNA-directed RNA polymerase subunit omega|nr:DNA-directed RNA polymerase subunit omega [Pirellulaceae bacterium]
MLEELKEEEIINKVGGRFKLSTLIQKRIVQLKQGSRVLIDTKGSDDQMRIVLQEILQDKIFLDENDEIQVAPDAEPVTDVPDINPLDL